MPISDELKKTLTDPTPLYALAGAGDLAYEKLREVPAKVEEITADRKAAQERAAVRLQEAQTKLAEAQVKVAETVSALPTDFKVLQEKAQTFALQQVGRAAEFAVKAKEVYDELAVRGKEVVEGRKEEEAAEIESAADVAEETAAPEPTPAVEASAEAETEAEAEAEAETPAKKTARARKTGTTKPSES